jgi:hypothetical protein
MAMGDELFAVDAPAPFDDPDVAGEELDEDFWFDEEEYYSSEEDNTLLGGLNLDVDC